MLSVTMIDANIYEVVVGGTEDAAHSPTRHQVYLSPDYYRKLCGGAFTHEWVIAQAFQILLERQPANAIPADLNLEHLGAGIADFESNIARRLGR